MRSHTGAITSKRLQRAPTQGLGFQSGPGALLHGGHDFKEAPVCSRTGAITSKEPQFLPAQAPGFQRGPSALTHGGHDFKEALV